jgi:Na+/proline symporter
VGLALLALATPQIDVRDTDTVLPQMINLMLPVGLKGFVLVGFLAAFMSTFSISINNGTSYVIRDIYIRHLRPDAGRREFLTVTYISSVLFVVVGILLGMKMSGLFELGMWVFWLLGGSMLIPLVLRWYWWRFNGWGFSCGLIAAFLVAVGQKVVQSQWGYVMPEYSFYFLMIAISLVVSILVAAVTPATGEQTLREFYRRTQPWGFWRPVHRAVAAENPGWIKEKMQGLDTFNCIVGATGLFAMNMAPIYFMLHNWSMFFKLLVVFLMCAGIMYRSWYKTLPTD